MAVPKKKTSNRKRNQRRATWNRKARLAAQRAMSLGKAVLSGRATGFHYPVDDAEDEDEDEEGS
ncbi:50S ribosomal protein L32 [Candidatus Synechococcus spongiarum]|uniref:50S ribosomal protein L32 n=1 Tax=Candidatus Synechococcus spongiarum TaxID=431041 RepID=UPI00094227D1|nr:50S ribosomal protein L32 [Candidatus Synechococcus spongiarum]